MQTFVLQQKLSTRVWRKVIGTIFLIHKNSLTTTIISFILLLWKCVYLYKYIDDWEKFNETSLPEEEEF